MRALQGEGTRRFPLWIVGWGLATISLVVFLRGVDLRAAWRVIAQANLRWVAVALGANLAVLPLLTEQWSRLLPKARAIRWRTWWDCVTLTLAAMNTLPFGGGHAVGVGLIARRAGVGWSAAVSLMALEQLCDAVAKLALLLVALALAPLPPAFRTAAWVLGGAMLLAFSGLLWLAHHPAEAPLLAATLAVDSAGGSSNAHEHASVNGLPRATSKGPERSEEEPLLRRAGLGWRAKWGQHLEVLKRPGLFLGAVSLSLAIKLCGLVAVFAVQRSLGVNLPLGSAALVLAAVTFATLVSVAPSDLGIYEGAAFGAYRLLGIPPGEAAALGLVQHFCFLLPMVGTGYVLTFWRMMSGPEAPLAESPAKLK